MSEKKVEKALVDGCKEKGWMCLKWTSPGARGVPDRIVITPYDVYFVELKQVGGRLSEEQKTVFERLHKVGHMPFVLYTIEEVKQWIEDINDVNR